MVTMMMMLLCGLTVSAEDGWGSFGNNISWYFTEKTGHLEITGTGDMPENESIPWSAYKTLVKSVTIGEGITSVADSSFEAFSNLAEVKLSSTLKHIGRYAFQDTALTSLTLPEGMETLDYLSFGYCSALRYVKIPSTMTTVAGFSFMNCRNLKAIKLGNNVTGIGYFSFHRAYELSAMYVPGSVTSIDDAAFYAGTENVTMYGYKNTAAWDFAGIETFASFADLSTSSAQKAWNTIWNKAGKINLNSSNTKVTLSGTSYAYNGKVRKPGVTVKYGTYTLAKDQDYTVSYLTGCKNVGKHTVQVTFKGIYSGTIKKTFTINPKSTSISSISGKTKSVKLKWKKVSSQISGYQIQYSVKKSFSGAKTVKVSGKSTSKTIKSLKKGTRYYVRVRTYKKVGSKVYYSKWSSIKKAVTK